MPLFGTGATAANPAVTLSPTSLTFSSQTVSTPSAAQAVTLTNSGNAVLTVGSIAVSGANAGDFAQTNTCSGSLTAGANCAISVVFTPTTSGSRSAQIIISDNASGSAQQVGLTGTGVSAASPDFAVSVAPQSATLSPGQSSPFALSVLASGGFSQSVTFACGGLPAGGSCSFSPATVTPSGNAASKTTLTIATTASVGVLLGIPRVDRPMLFETAASLLVFFVLLFLYRRRTAFGRQMTCTTQPALLFLLILFLALASLAGCASSSSGSPSKTAGTPAGTYSVAVTASSGALTHQVVLSLTVN